LLELDPGKIDERVVSSRLIDLPSGLRLLVGPQSVAEHRDIEPQQVETIISIIASMVDYAILDLPCYPSSANQAAIRRCDLVALVVEPESTALASGIVVVEQMRSWGLHGDRVGVIVVNRTTLPTPLKIDQFRAGLGHEVIGVIPTGSEAISAAQRAGLPVVLYRPDSDTSKAFVEITKRISASTGWIA
jgi:MinD-like ATPase involved in chromosome partitioning or flagellar assembly